MGQLRTYSDGKSSWMPIITLQVGQCGNQLGYEFFAQLSNENQVGRPKDSTHFIKSKFSALDSERFFRETQNNGIVARSVLIDTEPKVLQQIRSNAESKGHWKYDTNNVFCRQQGAGNNWASGYYRHGVPNKEVVMNLLRKESERCDGLSGFLILMSLAGGTGSGLGSRVTQTLREDYPRSSIINQVVWPFGSGEVIVQNYNALLSLAHLQDSSDAMCILENDRLHRQALRGCNHPVSLQSLNMIAAQQMASLYLPSYEGSRETNLGDLLMKFGCHPHYKLLRLSSVPTESNENSACFNSETWASLIKNLHRTQEDRNTFVSNLLVARGRDSERIDASQLEEGIRYAKWTDPCQRFGLFHHGAPLEYLPRSLTLASNSGALLPILEGALDKARNMFQARAYLHHYYKRGMSEKIFSDSFETIQQILDRYHHLD